MNYTRFESNFIHLDAVDSTNNYAANLIKATNVANGTTILTKRQDFGRGQRGNSWYSEPEKNLILSTIIYPALDISRAFYLNIVVSLAVSRTLTDFGIVNTIKWPNDIYSGDKKMGGILIENQLQGKKVKCSIAGLGLNVNQLFFPAAINATSMSLVLGKEIDLNGLLLHYFGMLDFYVEVLMQSNFSLLLKLYYKQMYRMGVWCDFSDQSGVFQGKIRGIDENGKLEIEREGGSVFYDLKEVKFLI